MSENRLEKYLSLPSDKLEGTANREYQPVLLSDSKGNYLRSHESDHGPQTIIWDCKGGRTTVDCLNWLKTNLKRLIDQNGKVRIYLWTGTCDLTNKQGKFISIKSNLADCTSGLKDNLRAIQALVQKPENSDAKITFLNVPYYSIGEWNKKKGYGDTELFKYHDIALRDAIDSINEYIDSINVDAHSPKFNADIIKTRKGKGKRIRYTVNHSLLTDGVHPGALLAKVWMKNILRSIYRECYQQH